MEKKHHNPNGINKESQQVPCGKCVECKKRRTSAWSFRLMQQEKVSLSAHFITLTYDTQHINITKRGFKTVSKRDLQLFFKKLRNYNTNTLKYFAAAEYGTKTMRPHYHIILFNADITTIQKAWTMGEVHYGEVTGASIGYTLKYIMKGKMIPQHKNDDRTPEFQLMSKQLGINYLTKNILKWHLNAQDMENRMHLNLTDGRKIAMPRYYKDKIYNAYERARIAHFNKLRLNEEEKKQNIDYYNKYLAQQNKERLNKINQIKNEIL